MVAKKIVEKHQQPPQETHFKLSVKIISILPFSIRWNVLIMRNVDNSESRLVFLPAFILCCTLACYSFRLSFRGANLWRYPHSVKHLLEVEGRKTVNRQKNRRRPASLGKFQATKADFPNFPKLRVRNYETLLLKIETFNATGKI